MQPHAGRPHSSPPSSSSRFSPTTTDPSRDVGELVDAADDRRFHERRSALTPLFDLRGNQSERRQFASEQASRRWHGGQTRRKFDSHTAFDAYEAMTSRIGVPRLTRMTVISPVFLLCARTVIMPSSPVRRSTRRVDGVEVTIREAPRHFDLCSGPRRPPPAPTRTVVLMWIPCSSQSSCCRLLVLSLA